MRLKVLGLIGLLMASPAVAQGVPDETLADIRQQLSLLYVDIQRLRTELSTTGGLSVGTVGNTPLDRLNAIEAELQRLTSKTEELEFRVNRITVAGTNRIGDLEFRLCELEPQCDIGMLGDTPSLGGVDSAAVVPVPDVGAGTGSPELAVGEQADFERASEALASGDFRGASDQFAAFVATYPGGPLSADAFYQRGQALEGLGEMSQAARAYLDSFSGDPDSSVAPQALFRLGTSLAALGQTPEACVTLGEVSVRFPGNATAIVAQSQMQTLGCS
jgi:tol-pal system protein YbgF